MNILNISGYKFVAIHDPVSLQKQLIHCCQMNNLKGTILLGEEGININLAGLPENIALFRKKFAKIVDFHDLVFKESLSDYVPFKRLYVKIKKEIVTMRHTGLSMANSGNNNISPKELKERLDKAENITLIDTRNDYETMLGSFKSAHVLPIKTFGEFPKEVAKLIPLEQRQQPVVIFCTGGIRCEKAIYVMQELGFSDVSQLEGGILNYFAECKGEHYEGECFVFDDRVAVDPLLAETTTLLCQICQMPVTETIQKTEDYAPGKFCPKCKDQTGVNGRFSLQPA